MNPKRVCFERVMVLAWSSGDGISEKFVKKRHFNSTLGIFFRHTDECQQAVASSMQARGGDIGGHTYRCMPEKVESKRCLFFFGQISH